MHAGGFLQKRKIVLESHLFANEALLRLILTHELFHFAWPRLGNPLRASFAKLVADELSGKARGELGNLPPSAKTTYWRTTASKQKEDIFGTIFARRSAIPEPFSTPACGRPNTSLLRAAGSPGEQVGFRGR